MGRGHDLFQRIRKTTIAAERAHEQRLVAQYLFEEVCAKTLYNLSGEPAPFDPDVPFRIVPNAILFARSPWCNPRKLGDADWGSNGDNSPVGGGLEFLNCADGVL